MGGVNTVDNIAVLTAREHYIAHLLLTKMTVGSARRKMAFALVCFNRVNPNNWGRNLPKSRLYAYSKELLSNTPVSPETGAKISAALTGKKHSAEFCIAIGNAHRGKRVSVETRAKMRDAKLGTTLSAETRSRMSSSKQGLKFSEEHCRNISKNYRHSEKRSRAIAEANKSKRKSCTVDGTTIYPSKHALEEILGRGKTGSRSPNFRYVVES